MNELTTRVLCARAARWSMIFATLALSGCVTTGEFSTSPNAVDNAAIETPAPEPGRYVAEPGYTPELIAQLRAAPAAETPENLPGTQPAGDVIVQRGQGFVRIGLGYYDLTDLDVDAWVDTQARAAGADRVLRYAVSLPAQPGEEHNAAFGADRPVGSSFESTSAANSEQPAPAVEPKRALVAAYFVRFKPPFGASFRDLTTSERANIGADGVWIGQVIGQSPADEANLAPGDVVMRIDGVPVRDRAMFQAQLRAKAGTAVNLFVRRGERTFSRVVRLGRLPGEAEAR